MRRVVKYVLLACALVLSCEIGLRLLGDPALQYYRDIKLLHRYHPDYNVTLAPNVDIYVRHFHGSWEGRFTSNSLGFRGSPEPDASRPQIACLGDSLVMGFGVSDQDTFCYRLKDLELGGQAHQAINLGVDAFGSLGSARRLSESAAKPGMNLKVALFFPSPNDFTIPPALAAQGVQPDDVIDAVRYEDDEYKFWFKIQFELTRHSYFLMAAKLSLEQLRVRFAVTRQSVRDELAAAGILKRPGHPEDEAPFFAKFSGYLGSVFYAGPRKPPPTPAMMATIRDACPEKSPYPCAPSEPDPARLPPLLDVTTVAYESMLATARERGFQLVVVLLPIQAETLYCTNTRQYSGFFDWGLRAGHWFRERGVAVIDLRDHIPAMCAVRRHPDGSMRYERRIKHYFIPADGHLTEIGNAWAAAALRQELTKLAASGRLAVESVRGAATVDP